MMKLVRSLPNEITAACRSIYDSTQNRMRTLASLARHKVVEFTALAWIRLNRGTPTVDHTLYSAPVLLGPLRGMRLSSPGVFGVAYWLGTYERHVVKTMRQYLRPGDIAYDIGGHVGYMAFVQSKLVGEHGAVYTFEPDPSNIQAMEASIANNAVTNVHAQRFVVAEKAGDTPFATFSFSLVNHIVTELDDSEPDDATISNIPMLSIDHFVYAMGQDPPRLIKIDVEGAEARVIEGATRTIKENRPIIIAEVHRDSLRHLKEFLCSQGYTVVPLGGRGRGMDTYGIEDVLFLPT